MPPAVVTVTLTVPDPLGAVTVMEVALSAVTVPGVAPKSTWVAELRLVPVTVTVEPPASGPATGETPVTVGTAT